MNLSIASSTTTNINITINNLLYLGLLLYKHSDLHTPGLINLIHSHTPPHTRLSTAVAVNYTLGKTKS